MFALWLLATTMITAFTLLPQPTFAQPVPCRPGVPCIQVHPNKAPAATSVQVTGSGWDAGDTIDLSFSTAPNTILTKAQVNPDGTFTFSLTPPNVAPGSSYFVDALAEKGNQTAQVPFEVTASSHLIPSTMLFPWDKNNPAFTFSGAPHGWKGMKNPPNNRCQPVPLAVASGLDFGTGRSDNQPIVAVLGGKVVYTNPHVDGQLRGVVIIDHGHGFYTQYWHLNRVNQSLQNVSIPQGTVIGLSGWAPDKHGNHINHLHLEFSRTGRDISPYGLTPVSAHGLTINGYTAWSLVRSDGKTGFNYQGTLTLGKPHPIPTTYDAVTGDHCNKAKVQEYRGDRLTIVAGNIKMKSTNTARNPLVAQISLDGIGHSQRDLVLRRTNASTLPRFNFGPLTDHQSFSGEAECLFPKAQTAGSSLPASIPHV